MSAVTNMGFMFYDASAFHQDLSKWDVSAVTEHENVFNEAAAGVIRHLSDFLNVFWARVMVKGRIRVICPTCVFARTRHMDYNLFTFFDGCESS